MTKKELEKENELLKQVICDIRRYICENLTNEYIVNGARFHLMGDVRETAHLMDIMGIVHYDYRDWDVFYFNTDVFKRRMNNE
ncbi:MAG TPA: hypothetical protein GX708_02335 [Gallicola sp.]|nr:hypothetical protein [Gallicola sp.]